MPKFKIQIERIVECMTKIEKIAHVASGLNEAASFYDNVIQNTNNFQNEGLEVEIQYGQSNNLFSALIIARKPIDNDTTLNIESVNVNNIDEVMNGIVERIQDAIKGRNS